MPAGCVPGGQLFFCPDARWRKWRVVWTHDNCWRQEKRFRSERRARDFLARKQGLPWQEVEA